MHDMKKWINLVALAAFIGITHAGAANLPLEELFINPPDAARPWVFWHWNNGNVTRDGITKDLEAFKRVGIGGVACFRIAGHSWAPAGPLETGIENQLPMIQWAAEEAERLGIVFSLTIDYGYGSGGPHISPENSMQRLYVSKTHVTGTGETVSVKLPKPKMPGGLGLAKTKSYRDTAVFAVPTSRFEQAKLIQENPKEYFKKHLKTQPNLHGSGHDPLMAFDGRGWKTHLPTLSGKTGIKALAAGELIDLTGKMDPEGRLSWDVPQGEWTVIRLGYGTNNKLTRPSPTPVVGLECDRLHTRGIEQHFEHRLRPVLEALKGKAQIEYITIDSWEALGQNWTKGFVDEFRQRRGYDPEPWLPVLTGLAVESAEKSERFLWDMRQTVGELIMVNYIDRLKELLKPYGTKFYAEPYGRLCVDSLVYAGRTEFPVAEFWTPRSKPKVPGTPAMYDDYWYNSMKGLASVANTYGKPVVGAEAFTGARGWCDHPYMIKGMGDEAFAEGISRYLYHISSHQPYEHMKPGITHRKWGQHFNRHQTWWDLSEPYQTYVTRCQMMLQQGRRVVDVACLYNEGAPLNFNCIDFGLPSGYDYDLCSPEIIQRMKVEEGRIVLPTGVSYRCLIVMPDRLTLPTAQKIDELRKAGARMFVKSSVHGTPGLTGYPEADHQVKALATQWTAFPEGGWDSVIATDHWVPDFEGEGLKWIHRRTADTDIYFVANTAYESKSVDCLFRNADRVPELWCPESGDRFLLDFDQADGRTRAHIEFGPAQSWFVVFRDKSTAQKENPFASWKAVREIKGPWRINFDPEWGTDKTVTQNELSCWSEDADPLVKYYSGTAVYRNSFTLDNALEGSVSLDLGNVEVMAQVFLNDIDCGVVWKAPYRVDISEALKPGKNELVIQVVNTWVNRMIGDEQLPLDAKWKNWEVLLEWPDWLLEGRKSPTGRYTFTTGRHYQKDSPLQRSGLLGPVRIMTSVEE